MLKEDTALNIGLRATKKKKIEDGDESTSVWERVTYSASDGKFEPLVVMEWHEFSIPLTDASEWLSTTIILSLWWCGWPCCLNNTKYKSSQ